MRKEKHAGIRVGAKAYELLRRRADELGLTFSAYARQMLFLEIPHVATFDVVDKVFDAARKETDPSAGAALLTQALHVVEQDEQALLRLRPFLEDLLGPRYEVALQEYAAAKRDIGERIAQIRGTVEMVTTVRKLGGMEP
jgi:hypothetical protein